MMRSRRAMFFTFIAILIILVLVTGFTVGKRQVVLTSQMPVVRTRAAQTNSYVQSLSGSLLPRIVQTSGTRALMAVSAYMNSTGSSLSDPSASISEVMLNGTLGGVDLSSLGITYMQGNTVPERIQEVADLASQSQRINTTYTTGSVTLSQDNTTGPWRVRAAMNVTLFIDARLMSWNISAPIIVLIPLEGIEDPYYGMHTNDYHPAIRRSEVVSGNWTLTLFEAHLRNVTYDYDINAPSFLMRLSNASGASFCCGIESMINPADYAMDLPSTANWSYVDHCFYGHQCNASSPGDKSIWNLSGLTSYSPGAEFYGFILTQYFIGKYGLTDYVGSQVVREP